MNITDYIRNYQVKGQISSELVKISREYFVLAALKYSFPERFSDLCKAEAPDLQDKKHSLGIEVTWGDSPVNEQINGESIKYSRAKTAEEKVKCLEKIKQNGGNRDSLITYYPTATSDGNIIYLRNAFLKKTAKITNYREKFNRVGLAIIVDIPFSIIEYSEWGKLISSQNSDGFNFVVLVHWEGIEMYDFDTKEYISRAINRNDRIALQTIGRLTAEGIIEEDDFVWQKKT